MLRESCELNSAEVAVVHCGERVLLIQEAGQRAKTSQISSQAHLASSLLVVLGLPRTQETDENIEKPVQIRHISPISG